MQQSQVRATKNGVKALEQAFSGITKMKQDVESTRYNLASGYKGSDGQAFRDLVNYWEQQATSSSRTCRTWSTSSTRPSLRSTSSRARATTRSTRRYNAVPVRLQRPARAEPGTTPSFPLTRNQDIR